MNYYKKRHSIKKLLYAGFLLLSILCFTNCSDDEKLSTELEFQTYLPESGSKGTALSIRGNNFGDDPAKVKVWVNEKEAEVTKVTKTRIYAIVPRAAGSGAIKVMVGEKEYMFPDLFTYQFSRLVNTYAGSGEVGEKDGTLQDASFSDPFWLAFDKKDNALFVLEENNSLRRIKNGQVETLLKLGGQINNPRSIEFSMTGDTLFIGNDNAGNWNNAAVVILKRSDDFKIPENLIMYPEAKTNNVNFCGVNPVDGSLIFYCFANKLYRWNKDTSKVELLYDITEIPVNNYASFRFSEDGKTIYLISKFDYQGILRADYDLATKKIVGPFIRFAGNGGWGFVDGSGQDARMDQPAQGATDSEGNLYTVERFNHCVRKITPEGNVSLYAGTGRSSGYIDGESSNAKFDQPQGIAFDNEGNLFISETGNRRIRIVKNE